MWFSGRSLVADLSQQEEAQDPTALAARYLNKYGYLKENTIPEENALGDKALIS